jgi:hypothetical protein
MERSRDYLPVRVGKWRKSSFLAFCCSIIGLLALTMTAGVIQSRTIPYFIVKDPVGGEGTDYPILTSRCEVDEYGNVDKTNYCFSHYFGISDIFTQYFSMDAFFKVKEAYKSDGEYTKLKFKITWLGRGPEAGTCKQDGCSACLKKAEGSQTKCLLGGASPCSRCDVECYRCIQSLGTDCDVKGESSETMTRDEKILSVCKASENSFSFQHWKKIAFNQTTNRKLRCHSGEKDCKPVVLFKTTHVEFNTYYFRVAISDITKRQLDMLDTVSFKLMFQNPKFSVYKLAFKYTFVVLNVIVLCLFEMKVRKRRQMQSRGRTNSNGGHAGQATNAAVNPASTGHGEMTLRQRAARMNSTTWVRVLLTSLLLFNNPLHAFEYFSSTRRFFGVLCVLFEIAFLGALFAFWLVEFDDLADEQSGTDGGSATRFHSCTCVCGLKSILVLSFLLVGAVSFSWIKVTEFADPLYDYHEDRAVWNFIRAFLVVWGIFYLLALSYFMFRAFGKWFCRSNSPSWFGTLNPCDRDSRRWQRAWLTLFHLFFMAIGVGGLAFGRVTQIEADTVFEFLFFSAVFNIYIFSLAYLYSPSLQVYTEGDFMMSMSRLDDEDIEMDDADKSAMFDSVSMT